MEMSLEERWNYVLSAIKEGYVLRQWVFEDGRVWLATFKNKEIGVFIHEIMEVLEKNK